MQGLFALPLIIIVICGCSAEDDIQIGAYVGDDVDPLTILALKSSLHHANIMQDQINFKSEIIEVQRGDSYKCAKLACSLMGDNKGLGAVFGPSTSPCASALKSVSSNFEIPHFDTSWQIPKAEPLAKTSLNLYPSAELLAQGLAVIVKNLQWRNFILLYETEGALVRLEDVLQLQKHDDDFKPNSIVIEHLGPGPDYRPLFKEIRKSYGRISRVILDCDVGRTVEILRQAKEQRMMEAYYQYFIVSLDAHTLNLEELDTSANITTIRLFNPSDEKFDMELLPQWRQFAYNIQGRSDNLLTIDPYSIKTETALMVDAVTLFVKAITDLKVTQINIETMPMGCQGEPNHWYLGLIVASYIKQLQPEGLLTGPIGFDSSGLRTNFTIYVVEKDTRGDVIATWNPDSPDNLRYLRSEVDTYEQLLQHMRSGTLIVSSQLMKPYLMERPVEEGEAPLEGNDRYEGFSLDLISEIANILHFKFRFELSKHGTYGKFDAETNSWTGLIRDILDRRADLAICDLTITPARRSVVDFSMPFMKLGISILYRKQDEQDVNMWAFLDPFSVEVWIYAATLYLTVSVILYFVSRMTPGDWENPHPCDQEPEELENIWDIKNCLWLTLGSIMCQGCDILPKGISSRMATSMWWFFSLIMTASYTANLAAFLTTQRMEPPIDSAEALAKQTKIKYGAMNGGSTQAFFRESNYTTYARMWTAMEQGKPSVFENSNQEGVSRVQNTKHRLYAFLMESIQIEYEVETKCDLKQVGGLLDSKGYGIAMPLDYPYRSAINSAILTLQETGRINQLKEKWWKEKRDEPLCPRADSSDEGSTALALANVGGVFLVLGLGVGFAALLGIGEFLWNVRNVSIEEHVTYWEALKVELLFALNVLVTKKTTKPGISESSSSSTEGGGDAKSVVHSILALGSLTNNKSGSHLSVRT